MISVALSLTYLGTVLLYVASAAAATDAAWVFRRFASDETLRGLGTLGLSAGFGLLLLGAPGSEGLLLWLAMGMASCSFVVITGPLAGSLLPTTALLAIVVAALAPWM